MKADQSGTPTEQARARRHWRSAAPGADAERCETCAHLLWPEADPARRPSPRCQDMPAEAYLGSGARAYIATRVRAVCDAYTRRCDPPPEQRAAAHRRELAAIRRTLLDPTLLDAERSALRARAADLARQIGED